MRLQEPPQLYEVLVVDPAGLGALELAQVVMRDFVSSGINPHGCRSHVEGVVVVTRELADGEPVQHHAGQEVAHALLEQLL